MDLKVYEKTRYQNIYRHKKNKNYLIMISKPVKTSISRIDDKKITDINEAMRIRDNVLIKRQKGIETLHREDFDTLWNKYIDDCKFVKKQAYNTLLRKTKTYNKYLKKKIDKPITKTTNDYWSKFIDEIDTTLKQKNQILKELRTFFNWSVENNIIYDNPMNRIKRYKVTKNEMKYWLPNDLENFFDVVINDFDSKNLQISYNAHKVYILVVLGFSLGNRTGETRALSFDCFNKYKNTVALLHSIDYNPDSKTHVSNTKTKSSQRIIEVSQKLIEEVLNYKTFLECYFDVEIKDESLLFYNYKNNKPYSDVALRKLFYKYCEKANVPKIRMYDLRHTYATIMISEGKDPSLFSKRMGHTSIKTTIDEYGHVPQNLRKELAQSTDKYIWK